MEELIILLQSIMDLQESRMQDFQQILKLQEANARMREVLDKKQSRIEEVAPLKKQIDEMRSTIEGLISNQYSSEKIELLKQHYGV